MHKLSDLIKGRLDAHSLSASAKSAEVIYKANQHLADLFKNKETDTKAYQLDGGVLFIAAENSSWSQEVWGVQESILKNLKKQFGKGFVKKIVIKSLTIN